MAKVQVDLMELDLDTLAVIDTVGKSGTADIYQMREIIAAFLVGDDGKPLEASEALRAAGKLKLREVKGAFEQINEAVRELRQTAVPKATTTP